MEVNEDLIAHLEAKQQTPQEEHTDGLTIVLIILAFTDPVLGGFIYLFRKEKHPVSARKVGKAAIYGLVFFMITSIAYILLRIAAG